MVTLDCADGAVPMTLSLAAIKPLSRGFTNKLPLQLKFNSGSTPKFVDGLTSLAKRYVAHSSKQDSIYGDASRALAGIAALEPSLFDFEMSSLLGAPRRIELISNAETPKRRTELIKTFIKTRFGLPMGALK